MNTRNRTRWILLVLWLGLLGILALVSPARLDPIGAANQLGQANDLAQIPAVAPRGETKLPVPAQAIASAVFGRDDAAFYAVPIGDGYRAENPRHDLVIDFGSDGVHIRAGGAQWGIAFRGISYGETNLPGRESAQLTMDGNRIEYRRDLGTEWYVNGPMGLEQGFTIDRPPVKVDGRAPLQIALELSGDLHAMVEPDGTSLAMVQRDGRIAFRYSGLVAIDAAGRELPAWLESIPVSDGDFVHVHVDDVSADYPIMIDPLIQKAELTASDGANGDLFGYWTAADGDTIVVGAYGAQSQKGAAYVFVKAGAWTTMTQTAKLTASDGVAADWFGVSVSISGNTIVVGTPAYSSFSPGAAYVFVKPSSGGWVTTTETAKLTPSDGIAGDGFGTAVSIDGDTIAVGAYRRSSWAGAAYVFTKPGSGTLATTTETAKLTASDSAAMDAFGSALSVNGDTILVGAPYKNSYTGAAYVFLKGTTWIGMTESARLNVPGISAGDYVGVSVSLSGDTAVVGAFAYGQSHPGSAYVFAKPVGGWAAVEPIAHLTASDGVPNNYFGLPVAVRGDTIVVGAAQTASNAGAAYVYDKPLATGWVTSTESLKLTLASPVANDNFGYGVSIGVNEIVVGAPGRSSTGAAYVFALPPKMLYLPLIRR